MNAYVSQSGLSEILKSIKKHGLPEAIDRRIIKRARDSEIPPSVFTSIQAEMEKGQQKTFPAVNPVELLKYVCGQPGGFSEYFWQKHTEMPSAPHKPWRICVYCDEIVPGNVLRPRNQRSKRVFGDHEGIVNVELCV